MTDMFPTKPHEWSALQLSNASKSGLTKGFPPNDETLRYQSVEQSSDLEAQKRYFKNALRGRKILVRLGNLVRGIKSIFSKQEPARSGERWSWYNQVEVPNANSGKKLYLGMIPDNLHKRSISKNALFVSILQDFEAQYMDSQTHSFRCVVNSEDNVGMKPDEIERGIEALRAAMNQKNDTSVYLHCKSGVGRSATVLAAYLMKYHDMTLNEAIDRVQRDRPDAQLRGWFGSDNKHTRALKHWIQIQQLGEQNFNPQEKRELHALLEKYPDLLKDQEVLNGQVPDIEGDLGTKLLQLANFRLFGNPPILIDSIRDLGRLLTLENPSPRERSYLSQEPNCWESVEGDTFGAQASWELPEGFQFEQGFIATRKFAFKNGDKIIRREVSFNFPQVTKEQAFQILTVLHSMLGRKDFEEACNEAELVEPVKGLVRSECEKFTQDYLQEIKQAQQEAIGFSRG